MSIFSKEFSGYYIWRFSNMWLWSQVDPLSCASSGMFVNLSAVMLRLCEPFLNANLTKRDKIDPKYVFYSNRLEFRWGTFISRYLLPFLSSYQDFAHANHCLLTCIRGLTALHASSDEVLEWIYKDNMGNPDGSRHSVDGENRLLQSQEATSSGKSNTKPSSGKAKYSFICECFFMTARVLNLGLLKAFSDFKHLAQVTRVFFIGRHGIPNCDK